MSIECDLVFFSLINFFFFFQQHIQTKHEPQQLCYLIISRKFTRFLNVWRAKQRRGDRISEGCLFG